MELESEKNLALAAQQASEAEKRKAQDAYGLAVQASDQFLTGIAEKLLTTPGVPKADVQQILDQADIFLDKLSRSAGSTMSALLARAKTHADLKLAELAAARGDYGQIRSHAQAARTTLLAGRQETDLARDDISLLAQTYLLEGRSFVESGEFDKATEPLQKAKQIADRARLASPADRAVIDATGATRYWISANELDLGQTMIALNAAKDCIADLNTGGQGALSAQTHLYIAKCEDILGAGVADDFVQHYQDAVDEIGKIPETQRDRETLIFLGALQDKLGDRAENQKQLPGAYRAYLDAAQSINQILLQDPYDAQARDIYATYLYRAGNVVLLAAKQDSSYYKNAKDRFVDAYDARKTLYNQDLSSGSLWIHLASVLAYPVHFMDARFPGDDPVERSRSELETFEGLEIMPSRLKELKDLFVKAEQEKRGFIESLVFAQGGAYGAATIALDLEADLIKGDIKAAVDMLQTQWSRDQGAQAVTDAITRLVRNGASAAVRGMLVNVADELTANNHDSASIAILNILIETATGERDLAALSVKRADARARAGVGATADAMDLRDRDLEVALALAPGDPHIELLLGSDWVEQDKYLASAATLLEHVLSLEPDNASVKDSLGWDYVKTGKLEQGTALLLQAAAAKPNDAAMLLHLANAHRLAGDTEKAKQELAKALTLDPNDHVFGEIESEQDILTPPSDKEPPVQESAAAIAGAMQETDFHPSKAVSTDAVGLAISGYDPVAFFSRRKAVLGKGEYFTLWNGALWLFASADDRARFVQHPDRYAPAFGGFCSFCVSSGHKYHGDPQAWIIYAGTLYLHASAELRADWENAPDYYIEKARSRWTRLADAEAPSAASTRISDEIAKVQDAWQKNAEFGQRIEELKGKGVQQMQSGDKTGALASFTGAYGLVQAEIVKDHPKVDKNLAEIAGGLAYEILFTGDYSKALSLAEQALALDPMLILNETNHADALMLLGRIEEARAIYLKYQHVMLSDGKRWEDDVEGDFAELRKAGLTSPLMDEIEKAFQSSPK